MVSRVFCVIILFVDVPRTVCFLIGYKTYHYPAFKSPCTPETVRFVHGALIKGKHQYLPWLIESSAMIGLGVTVINPIDFMTIRRLQDLAIYQST